MNLLIESSIRALVLALGVAAVLRLARVRSGAARHAAWTAVLLAMLVMPLLSRVVPPIVVRSMAVPLIQVRAPVSSSAPSPPARPASSASQPSADTGLRDAARLSTASTPPAAIPPAAATFMNWQVAGAFIYVAGVLVLFSRLIVGWRAMRRLVRSSRPAAVPAGETIFESPAVAAPLTVGAFRSRIVLPVSWVSWSEEMRTGVLAHERAHVRRHDALVSLLAYVNRCVFWFHPLAWWLERTLAASAEDACDAAGVRAIGEPKRYAAILIALAGDVRERGGRVAWQGLGVGGNGSLTDRIDRVVRENGRSRLSFSQRIVTVAGSAIVLTLAIACQGQKELRPDPEVLAKLATADARRAPYRDRSKVVAAMTDEKASAMEAALRQNPNDAESHQVLLEYYLHRYVRTEPQRYYELRRPHALWLIEHAPEGTTGNASMLVRFSPRDSKAGDLDDYEAGKKLWLAHLAKPDVSARLLRNAAAYFKVWDVPLAEEALLRGQAAGLVDPDEPGHLWYGDLARFYMDVLQADLGLVVRYDRKPPFDEHAYAIAVRQKLAESNDVALLTTMASWLLPTYAIEPVEQRHESELRGIGQACLDRALLLDPQSTAAKDVQARIPAMARDGRLSRFMVQSPPDAAKSAEFAALPDEDKFYLLPRFARSMANTKPHESTDSQARKFADDALALAPRFRNSAVYSPSVFTAHMTLAELDVRADKWPDAVGHLRSAADVPSSLDIKVLPQLGDSPLLVALLKHDERDAVISFLERMTNVSTSPDEQRWLHDSADKLRKGLMPEWYERAVALR